MLKAPQFDFITLDFVTRMTNIELFIADIDGRVYEKGVWAWSGPSQPLQNIVLAVMGLGQILPIPTPAPNASWTLDFWGPALQCNDVVATERDQIWTNIWNSYSSDNSGSLVFLSWAPWPPRALETNASDPHDHISNLNLTIKNQNLPFQFDEYRFSPWQISTGGPASLFVAVSPEAQNIYLNSFGSSFDYIWPEGRADCPLPMLTTLEGTMTLDCIGPNISFKPASFYEDSTLLRCDLLNTSYSVAFTYQNDAQSIRASTNTTGISPVVNASDCFIGPGPLTETSDVSELSNCRSLQLQPWISDLIDYPPPCLSDVDSMHLLSYQGIMTAFNQLVMGDIKNYDSEHMKTNTTILKTILAETTEFLFLRDWYLGSDEWTLQNVISYMSGGAYSGLLNLKLPHTRADLKSTLEQAFQNFTISLLAEPYFQ